MVGIVLTYEKVINRNMGEYTGLYSLFNMYVYILAFLYSPADEFELDDAQLKKLQQVIPAIIYAAQSL